jgi:mycofactocin precursor
MTSRSIQPQAVPAPDEADETVDDAGLVEEDLLVEEISIDGMCGVY